MNKILIIDNAEPVDSDYNRPLLERTRRIISCEMRSYQDVDETIIESGKFSGVILSGVPTNYSFDTIDERAEHLKWLHTTSLPVLGICLGHQSMGKVFKASVLKHEEAENGLVNLAINERSDPIFSSIDASRFEVMSVHRGSITLPGSFELLASSTLCQNQIMKHATKPLYGFQFHPEQSSAGDVLLRNFVNLATALEH